MAAQRRAVRAALLREFPASGHILEIGGGTGEDASFLAKLGFDVLLTDPSPTMVTLANAKLASLGSKAEVAAGEELEDFADRHLSMGGELFDGAFSNFAPLNCVVDLEPVARGLARLMKPGARAMLVLFGTLCPGEMLVETLRGRPHLALRRCRRGVVPARLAKREFEVVYHRRAEIARAFAPWFVLKDGLGIGVTVPPSAAEPWISTQPRLLKTMEILDRFSCRADGWARRPCAVSIPPYCGSNDVWASTGADPWFNKRMTRPRHLPDTWLEATGIDSMQA